MANKTQYQIAVVSCDKDGNEELLHSSKNTFNPDTFRASFIECETELAHGMKLIDEVTRKLVIEIEFDTEDSLEDRAKDVHDSFRHRCFNYDFKAPVVVEAEILPPKTSFDRSEVRCLFSNGVWRNVFAFFSDELSFYPSEFKGRTYEQCQELFTQKDIAYLRS